MRHFDAEQYTISIRKEVVEGDELYVARIAELPDVQEFGESYEETRSLALDTLITSYDLCCEKEIPFPKPMVINDEHDLASGRVTLRMPKTLHTRLIKEAELEDVSLNQYLVSSLSINYGQCKLSENVLVEMNNRFKVLQQEINKYQNVAATYLFKDYVANFQAKETPSWTLK